MLYSNTLSTATDESSAIRKRRTALHLHRLPPRKVLRIEHTRLLSRLAHIGGGGLESRGSGVGALAEQLTLSTRRKHEDEG
jgi:hypothetical protein